MSAPAIRSVRFSELKAMAQTPAHYRHAVTTERDDTPAMRRGRAIHAYMLGSEDSVIRYEGRRAGKAWDAFKSAHHDDEILIASELADVDGMRAAIRAHHPSSGPSAMELLTSGRRERRIRWQSLGRQCSGTPDVDSLVEFKSARTVEPDRFCRDARRMHYHAQVAWYYDALTAIGSPPRHAWIVAVESTPPHIVQCFRVTERALDEGRKMCRLWLERLLQCEAADVWPGYLDCAAELEAEEVPFALKIGGEDVAIGPTTEAAGATTDDEDPF